MVLLQNKLISSSEIHFNLQRLYPLVFKCQTEIGAINIIFTPDLSIQVINKRYFSEAFLFKPRGGRSPPNGLNRKPRKNPLFSL